jgi:hypothetical protein
MASLSEQLETELKIWRAKTYSELLAIEYPYNYETRTPGESVSYQVEVDLLERNDQYVHICVGVSDGGWSSFFPKATSFLAYADDRFHDRS